MKKIKMLFVCVHNSFRSQLAQAIANKNHAEVISAQSAGLDASRGINPLAIKIGHELGYDLSGHHITDVFDLYKEGHTFDVVVAVCSHEAYERCPIFPGVHDRLHWPLVDPSALDVSEEEKEEATRNLIQQLEEKIHHFVSSIENRQV